jgi:hypothetical protein
MSWTINRRRLLTGAGAILALPMLESIKGKNAFAAGADPRRFISLYMPNGTYNKKGDAPWYPKDGVMSTASLPPVLSPFSAQQVADFSVLKHIRSRVKDNAGAPGAHVGAVTTFLTEQGATDYGANQCTVPGTSFDQMVANAFGKPNLVMSGGCVPPYTLDNTPYQYADFVSYSNGKPTVPDKNPVDLFNRMFASLAGSGGTAPTGDAASAAAAAARKKSILDNAVGDLKDMQSKLGKNDRLKLDDYLTNLRALELRLTGTGPAVASGCVAGTAPPSTLGYGDLNGTMSSIYIQRVQAFFDMVVLGFRCDTIRSVSFMYDGDAGQRINNPCPANLLVPGVSLAPNNHTGISHYGSLGDAAAGPGGRERCISRDRNYVNLFLYLTAALKAAVDPSGTPILDNTIVYSAFQIEDGNHDDNLSDGAPTIVGGGKNIGLHPGSALDMTNTDRTDLYYTFSRLLGMNLASFGGSTRVLSV